MTDAIACAANRVDMNDGVLASRPRTFQHDVMLWNIGLVACMMYWASASVPDMHRPGEGSIKWRANRVVSNGRDFERGCIAECSLAMTSMASFCKSDCCCCLSVDTVVPPTLIPRDAVLTDCLVLDPNLIFSFATSTLAFFNHFLSFTPCEISKNYSGNPRGVAGASLYFIFLNAVTDVCDFSTPQTPTMHRLVTYSDPSESETAVAELNNTMLQERRLTVRLDRK